MESSMRSLLVQVYGIDDSADHADAIDYMVSAMESYAEDHGAGPMEVDYVESLMEPFLLDMGMQEDIIRMQTEQFIIQLDRIRADRAKNAKMRERSTGSRGRPVRTAAPIAIDGGKEGGSRPNLGASASIYHTSGMGRSILGRALSQGSTNNDSAPRFGEPQGTAAAPRSDLLDRLDDPMPKRAQKGGPDNAVQTGDTTDGKKRPRRRRQKRNQRGHLMVIDAETGDLAYPQPEAPEAAGKRATGGAAIRRKPSAAGGGGLGIDDSEPKPVGLLLHPSAQRERSATAAQKLRGSGAGYGSAGRQTGGSASASAASAATGASVGASGGGIGATVSAADAADPTGRLVPQLLRQESALGAHSSFEKSMRVMLDDDTLMETMGEELSLAETRYPGCRLRCTHVPSSGMCLLMRAIVRTDKSGFDLVLPLMHLGAPKLRQPVRAVLKEGSFAKSKMSEGLSTGRILTTSDTHGEWMPGFKAQRLENRLNVALLEHMQREVVSSEAKGLQRIRLGWLSGVVEMIMRECLQEAARGQQIAENRIIDKLPQSIMDKALPADYVGPPALRRQETMLEDPAGKGIKARRKAKENHETAIALAGGGFAYRTSASSQHVPATPTIVAGVGGHGIDKDLVSTTVVGADLPSGYVRPASFVIRGKLFVHGAPYHDRLLSFSPGTGQHRWLRINTRGTLRQPPQLQNHQAFVRQGGEVLIYANARNVKWGFFSIRVTTDVVTLPSGNEVQVDSCSMSNAVVAEEGRRKPHLNSRYGARAARLPGGSRYVILGGIEPRDLKRTRREQTPLGPTPLASVHFGVCTDRMVVAVQMAQSGNTARCVRSNGSVPKVLIDHEVVTCGRHIVVVGGDPLVLQGGKFPVRVLDTRHFTWFDVQLPIAGLQVRGRSVPMVARLPGTVGVILFGGATVPGEPLGGLYSLVVDMSTASQDKSSMEFALAEHKHLATQTIERKLSRIQELQPKLEAGDNTVFNDVHVQAQKLRAGVLELEQFLEMPQELQLEKLIENNASIADIKSIVHGRWELLHSKVRNPKATRGRVKAAAASGIPTHLDINPVAAGGVMERLGSSLIVFGGLWADAAKRTVRPNSKAFVIDANRKSVRLAGSQYNLDMARMWDEQLLVDVVIRCSGGELVPAHRSILFLFFPYFRGVFSDFHRMALEADGDTDSDDDSGVGDGDGDDGGGVDEEEAFRLALLADLGDHVGDSGAYSLAPTAATDLSADDGGDGLELRAGDDTGDVAQASGDGEDEDGFMTESQARNAAVAALRRAESTGAGAGAGSVGGGKSDSAQLLMPPLDPPDGVMEIEEDMDGADLRMILGYVYTGGIEVPAARVEAVKALATLLGLNVSLEEAQLEQARKIADANEAKEAKEAIAELGNRGKGAEKQKKSKKKKSSGASLPPAPLQETQLLEGGVEAFRLGRLVELCDRSRGLGISSARNPMVGSPSPSIREHLRTGLLRNVAVVTTEKAESAQTAAAAASSGGSSRRGAAFGSGRAGGEDEDEDQDQDQDLDESGIGEEVEIAVAGVSEFLIPNCALLARDNHDVAPGEESVSIPAHRAILAARSPYFRSLFDAGMQESRAARVPVGMEDAGRSATEALLKYLYDDTLSGLEPDDAPVLLTLANLHVLPRLAGMCERVIVRSFDMTDPESVLGIYGFAAYQGQAGRRLSSICVEHLLQLELEGIEEAAAALREEVGDDVLRLLQTSLRAVGNGGFRTVSLLRDAETGARGVGEGGQRVDAGDGEGLAQRGEYEYEDEDEDEDEGDDHEARSDGAAASGAGTGW